MVFLERASDATPTRQLDLDEFAPEGLTAKGSQIYLDLPGGQARSKLIEALTKQKVFGKVSTSRNWRTVEALTKMAN